MKEEVKIRPLTPAEIHDARLERKMSDPKTAVVFGAIEGNQLIGYCICQMVMHAEPLWVDPEHRGNRMGITEQLAEIANEYVSQHGKWVCVTTNPFVDRICQSRGMKKIDGQIYVGGEL